VTLYPLPGETAGDPQPQAVVLEACGRDDLEPGPEDGSRHRRPYVVEGVPPEDLERRVRHSALGHRMGKRSGLSPGSIRHNRFPALLKSDKRVICGGSDLRKRDFSTAPSTRVETMPYSKPNTGRAHPFLVGEEPDPWKTLGLGPGGKAWGLLLLRGAARTPLRLRLLPGGWNGGDYSDGG
jgi:hypothetical protein